MILFVGFFLQFLGNKMIEIKELISIIATYVLILFIGFFPLIVVTTLKKLKLVK